MFRSNRTVLGLIAAAVLVGTVSVSMQGPWTTPPGSSGKVRIVSTAADALGVGCSGVSPTAASCTGGIYGGAHVLNGHLTFGTTATYDVGATSAIPRDVYVGRNLVGPAEYNAGNSSTAITLNFTANGPIQKVTRNGNCTYTLTAPPSPGYVSIRMVHDATANSYTVTFSPTVKFPNGTAPTWTNTNSAIDIITLYYDGSAYYGVQIANFS